MANHGDDAGKRAEQNSQTYEGFLAATKWGVIFIALALILMAIFLVR